MDLHIDPGWALVPETLEGVSQPYVHIDLNPPLAIRLPTELLLQIFSLCTRKQPGNDDGPFNPTSTIILTHVCQRWRAVALDYPLLWSTISFRTPYLARLMLDRSQDAPLIIRCDFVRENEIESQVAPIYKAARRALRHSSRAKEISLRSRSGKQLAKLVSDTRPPGEMLESLSLLGVAERYYNTVFDLPVDLFARAPVWPLRKLVLERVKLPPNVLPRHCAHLVHLELHYVTPLSVEDVLHIARAASNTLEVLILDLVPLSLSTELPTEPIPVPRIRRLHLNCTFGDLRANSAFGLLPLLTIPPTASIRLQVLLSGLWLTAPPLMAPTLVTHAAKGAPLRAILISQANLYRRRGLRLHAWTSTAAPTFFHTDDMPLPKLDVQIVREPDGDNTSLHRALLDLIGALPLHTVRSATIARLDSIPAGLFTTVLPALAALEEITVHGSSALHALCSMPSAAHEPPLVQMAGLHTLAVYEAVGAGDFRPLRRTLQQRIDLGIRLPSLVVCYSNVVRSVMEGFAGLAGEVLWDGSVSGMQTVPVPMEVEATMELPVAF
ncbi:hypothetical protein FA95DRAFT_640882 [Auriscalpium vulgare]|uniref:Uncharacterized protein n=1 Tax=Auriscalpium vulgare TaxID=40419 RepID=A0ACB8S349_9AGAM|nr:hypothetical protein FA95DRAFT_640882 [Auriscalpium vulgare]